MEEHEFVTRIRCPNFHAMVSFEYELWKDLDLEMRLIWDRQNNPATTGVGQPVPHDDRLYFGLGYEF